MDKILLKDLKKQDRFSKFFYGWKEREFREHPDEKQMLKDLEVLSQQIGMREGLVIACFDYRDLSLAFFAGNVVQLSGYPEYMFRTRGVETTVAMLHPEDRTELYRFQKIVFDVFHKLSIPERHTFEFSYTTRWVNRSTKETLWMAGKVKPFLIDSYGNFAMDLHVIIQLHAVPKVTCYDWSYSYKKDDGTRVFVSKNSPKKREVKLTKKEKEIVKLILEGKESKGISEILNISVNTVATHRKNILKKLDARNVGEMVKILTTYDF